MKKKTKNQLLAIAQLNRLRREGCTNLTIVIKNELMHEFAAFRKMLRLRREFPWAARDCMKEAINDWLNKMNGKKLPRKGKAI